MKAGLIVFGVIFLVIGGLLYYVPMQELKAGTTTAGDGSTDTRTSSASVIVPVGWAYASAIIGFLLLLFGLVIPGASARVIQGPRGPRGSQGYQGNRGSRGSRGTRTVFAVQGPRGPRGRAARKSSGTSVTTTTRTR